MSTSWSQELRRTAREQDLWFPVGLEEALRHVPHVSNRHPETLAAAQALAVSALSDVTLPYLHDVRDTFGQQPRFNVHLAKIIERWTGKSVRGNTSLHKAIDHVASCHDNDSLGKILRATACLFRLSYPVNYKNPYDETTKPLSGDIGAITHQYLLICMESGHHEPVVRERAVVALIEKLSEM